MDTYCFVRKSMLLFVGATLNFRKRTVSQNKYLRGRRAEFAMESETDGQSRQTYYFLQHFCDFCKNLKVFCKLMLFTLSLYY